MLEPIFYYLHSPRFRHLRPVMPYRLDCDHFQTAAGGCLPPDRLLMHRQTHAFKAPCCLCASVDPDLGYTEMAIVVSDRGEFVSEYVAECVIKLCRYLGESYGPF